MVKDGVVRTSYLSLSLNYKKKKKGIKREYIELYLL